MRHGRAAIVVVILLGVAGASAGARAADGDPLLASQWSLHRTGVPDAWALTKGKGATVAVLDTGVETDHPDLVGRVAAGVRCMGTRGDAARCEGSARDDNGRGTHALGLVGAREGNGVGIAGVAPEAHLIPVKVATAGTAETADLAAGVDWAVAEGAQVVVVSIADGVMLGPTGVLGDAVERAWIQGTVVVVPAGVLGDPHALVVTATDRDDRLSPSATPVARARWGLAAPGGRIPEETEGVLSTWTGGTYRARTGTARAMALAGGAATLLRATGMSADQTIQRLLKTALDLGTAGPDETYGAGRLDVRAAVLGPHGTDRIESPRTTTTVVAAVRPAPRVPVGTTAPAVAPTTVPAARARALGVAPQAPAPAFTPAGDVPRAPATGRLRLEGGALAAAVAAALVLLLLVTEGLGTPSVAGRSWPALDGVRGVSILLVLAFHLGLPGFRGGFLGVDVFFVLSGFLVTAVLVAPAREDGVGPSVTGAALGRFYWRRATRLFPAFFAVLLAVGLWNWLHPDPVFADAVAYLPLVAAQLTDFVVAFGGHSVGVLTHTWSLACEVQFYLLWPLLLLITSRLHWTMTNRLVATVACVVGVAGWRAMAWRSGTAGWFRTYFSFDTRVDALLLGSAVAFALRAGLLSDRRVVRFTRVAAVLGVVLLGVMVVKANETYPSMYLRGGFLLPGVAAAAVVASMVAGPLPVLGTCFRSPPLVRLGRISYSLYLWHLPIFLAFGANTRGVSFEARVASVAVSVLIACISFFAFERPLLSRRPARPERTPEQLVPSRTDVAPAGP